MSGKKGARHCFTLRLLFTHLAASRLTFGTELGRMSRVEMLQCVTSIMAQAHLAFLCLSLKKTRERPRLCDYTNVRSC